MPGSENVIRMADLEAQRLEMLKDKKAVEKSNKDEVFKYHIAKVDESDYAVEEEPEITNEDFVLAIRPEALKLSKDGSVASTIYWSDADRYGVDREVKDRKVPPDRRDLRRRYL